MKRVLLRCAAMLGAAATMLVLGAPAASAHPLGNLSVNRYTGIVITPDRVVIDHVIDLAEIPTAQLGERVQDLPILARDECASAAAALVLTADGTAATIVADSATAKTRPGQGGLLVTRIECRMSAGVDIDTDTLLELRDDSSAAQVGWREITAVGDRTTLTRADVPVRSLSDRLSRYPDDLLSSPPDTRTASLVVSPGGPALHTTPAGVPDSAPAGWLAELADNLLARGGLVAGGLAVLVAILLGASHALAPGHGKTVMAFYLSRRDGNALRSAVAVGASVTLAHTGTVLLFAALVSLTAAFVPARWYPWLALLTGILILWLGASLLRRALRTRTDDSAGHGHGHGHGHGLGHGHGHVHSHGHHHGHHHEHGHSHSPHEHAHDHGGRHGDLLTSERPASVDIASPPAPQRRWELGVVGLVGGLVPSPSALLLMLGAVALGKAWFGALLVIAFGLGMAVTLAVVGILAHELVGRLERAAHRCGRFGGSVRRLLSVVAAAGVCGVGVGVVARAILQF